MSKRHSKFKVAESDLLCKNRCGFYGNTAWKGYCSVCYKSLSVGRRPHRPHYETSEPQTTKVATRAVVNTDQNFTKFEEKRRQQSDRITGTVRSLFSKSSKRDKPESHATSKGASSRQG